MLGLLVQVKPYADESLLGYLFRLAEANGLEGTTVLGLFRKDDGGIGNPGRSANEALQTHPSWAGMAAELSRPLTRPMPVRNIRRRRFCVACLQEEPFWRAAWDLTLVTACGRHKLELQDGCPHCGATLHWNGHALLCCHVCGQALVSSTVTAAPASRTELWLSKELTQRMTGSHRYRDRQLKHLELEEFHELAFRFGCHVSQPKRRKPKKVADSGSLQVGRVLAQAAGSALDDWPNGFFRALDRIRAERDVASHWKLAAALGPIYREIFVGLSGSAYQFIREAFEAYLQRRWQAPLAKRHRRLDSKIVRAHHWLSVDEAASRANVNPSVVERLVKAGEIPSRKQQYQSGRHACVVDMTALGEIAIRLQNALTIEQAAQVLGLPKLRVRQLINAGILKIWGGTPGKGAQWKIDQISVEAIIKCANAAPPIGEIETGGILFEDLLRYRINGEKDFTGIVSSILNGDIRITSRLEDQREMRAWILRAKEVNMRLNHMPSQTRSALSIVAVSKELGVKQEVAYALARYGLIKGRSVFVGKRPVQFVTSDEVAAFHRQYVSGVELTKITNISPKKIAELMKLQKIYPVIGPTILNKFCRQYFWRRTGKLKDVIDSLITYPICSAGSGT